MLETKFVGDRIVDDGPGRFFVPNLFTEILCNIGQQPRTTSDNNLGRRHHDLNYVTKIKQLSPVLIRQHYDVINITLDPRYMRFH